MISNVSELLNFIAYMTTSMLLVDMIHVKSTWAIDGRIICLLTSGRKETIVHDRDLVNLRELCRQ